MRVTEEVSVHVLGELIYQGLCVDGSTSVVKVGCIYSFGSAFQLATVFAGSLTL